MTPDLPRHLHELCLFMPDGRHCLRKRNDCCFGEVRLHKVARHRHWNFEIVMRIDQDYVEVTREPVGEDRAGDAAPVDGNRFLG